MRWPALRRNWPGILSLVLAAASVGMYVFAVSVSWADPLGPLIGQFVFSAFQLGTATSTLVGFLAIRRARRGGGGMATAVAGLVAGGSLLFLWVAWIAGLLIFNPSMGE